MALAVASTSTVATSNADSLTITKPTGVASGDLLVIVAGGEHDGNAGVVSQIACSGFTKQLSKAHPGDNLNTDLNLGLVFLWKIADSGDVSASDYTITLAGSETLGIATMFRITGWTSGNPIFSSSENNAITATGLSLARPQAQLLIMVNAIKQDNIYYSFATPSITSSDSNPTWTEVQDANITVNAATDGRSLSMAVYYANSSNTSTITAYSVTETNIGGAGGTLSGQSFLAVLVQPTDVTGDVSHLAVTPTVESVTASSVTVVADVSHLAVTPTINGVETITSSDSTQWTNETKPASTTWTNQTK